MEGLRRRDDCSMGGVLTRMVIISSHAIDLEEIAVTDSLSVCVALILSIPISWKDFDEEMTAVWEPPIGHHIISCHRRRAQLLSVYVALILG